MQRYVYLVILQNHNWSFNYVINLTKTQKNQIMFNCGFKSEMCVFLSHLSLFGQ